MNMNDTLQSPSINDTSSTISVDIVLRKILLGCLLFSLSIFTIFGNLLVFYAIQTEKRLRTVSNLFILSLAFADLVVGLIVMPLSAANIITGRWPFSSFICQMWLSIDYVASTASIFNLVLLSLDRYWAVVHPLHYLQNRTRKRATNFIIIVWFVSLLWAPAVIFWSHIVPKHSVIIKPNECDTSFRSNKIFKTLTALVNFYIPLLTMIAISCRIMVAIRSRSTMECGRRISSGTQKKMRRVRTFTATSLLRHDNRYSIKNYSTPFSSNDLNGQASSVSVIIDPFESIIKKVNIPKWQSDENTETSFQTSPNDNDDNESFCQYEPIRTPPVRKKRFSFAHLKPITILFPSLSSIKEHDKRKSEDLSKINMDSKTVRNSISVSHDMKYADSSPIKLNHLSRTLSSTSSLSDEYPQTIFVNPIEQQMPISVEQITVQSSPTPSSSSPTHIKKSSIFSSNNHLEVPSTAINNSKKMNILTFLDYIINPSLSRSLQKELKAARQLGMLVGVFTVSWLPYFILFLVVAWCENCVPDTIFTASIWLGYLNSTFNPLIYPLCNMHFRHAFKKIFYCQHAKTKIPNLNALRELHALHSLRRRR